MPPTRPAVKRTAPGARRSPVERTTRAREDWITAALAQLIGGGVNAVKIGKLARTLRVSRASFYWHFVSRAELLNELVKRWESTNSRAFERVMAAKPSADAMADYQIIVDAWVHERDYSSAFDTAMREWARGFDAVAKAVRRVDERRIASLHELFVRLGFTDPEALVRARICYFHQVGYYALDFGEPPAQRLALEPFYTRVFTGRRGVLPARPSLTPKSK